MFGAAKMVLETGLHPGVLKDQGNQSGGAPPSKACMSWKKAGGAATVISAVRAATEKSRKLGQG